MEVSLVRVPLQGETELGERSKSLSRVDRASSSYRLDAKPTSSASYLVPLPPLAPFHTTQTSATFPTPPPK